MNILHIISSPRANASYSYNLGKKMIEKLALNAGASQITERRLTEDFPVYISSAQITGIYTSPELRSEEQKNALRYSDEVIEELQNSDVVIISTPMYNLGLPATLKAWLDQIVRVGVTFTYDAAGAKVGQVIGKKVYLAIASGRVYEGGEPGPEYIESYVRTVLESVGVNDLSTFRIEGTVKKDIESINYQELIGNL